MLIVAEHRVQGRGAGIGYAGQAVQLIVAVDRGQDRRGCGLPQDFPLREIACCVVKQFFRRQGLSGVDIVPGFPGPD